MEQIEKEKLQQKANGQEDHLTKASTGSKRRKGLLQEWFGDTGTIGKTIKERKAIREELLQLGEPSCKITSGEQLLHREESIKKKDMHESKFGVKSLCSMKLHR